MGDRFYTQQSGQTNGCKPSGTSTTKKYDTTVKPKRKLKADWVKDIGLELGIELPGLSKTDLTTLENLYGAIIDAKSI